MSTSNVEKAVIVNLNTSEQVECHFNPAEFGVGKTLKWEEKADQGSDTPKIEYSGAEAQDMSLTLLFDTTDSGGEKDVRDEYSALVTMAQVDPGKKNQKTGKGEPPMCRFQWGKFLAFNAVIKDLKQKFILFAPNGTPLRVEVALTLKQVGELTRPQNPTSRSEARKIWSVEEGQRLDWIAYQEYGDPAQWRFIAETNNLDNPDALYSGQILKLVPLP
jgi:nucleoid-associated protein YgaU